MYAKYAINPWLSRNYVMGPSMNFANFKGIFPPFTGIFAADSKYRQQAEGLQLGRRHESWGKLFRTEK